MADPQVSHPQFGRKRPALRACGDQISNAGNAFSTALQRRAELKCSVNGRRCDFEEAPCQDPEPHRVLPNGWSVSHPSFSFVTEVLSGNAHGKNVFLPVNEAPLERPQPSPVLRSLSLEFGNSLECGPQLGSRAAGLGRPETLECGKRHLRGRGRVLEEAHKIEISTNTKR